jgi:hypothetical protein
MNFAEPLGSRKCGKYAVRTRQVVKVPAARTSHGAILFLLMTERFVICITLYPGQRIG